MDFSIYVLTIVYLTSSIAAPGNNDRLTLKIHGGSNAPIGKFPSIGYLVDSYGINICGATLISREWAVTAAHCFFGFEPEDPSPGRVVFGNIDAGAVNYNHQESCFEVFIHEDYNDDGLINDIALIQLKKPVDINPFLRPVNVSKTFADTTTYRECYIAGWGATENDVYPDELQFTKVEVFNMSACDNLRDMESYFEDALENEDLWICAGSNTSDACVGDSGGPLYCIENLSRKHTLVGVVSAGQSNCTSGSNGLYTKLAAYTQWIEQTTFGASTKISLSFLLFITCFAHAFLDVALISV